MTSEATEKAGISGRLNERSKKMTTHPKTLTAFGWRMVCGDYLRHWWAEGMRRDEVLCTWFAELCAECNHRHLVPWQSSERS
jgi:hypothetical protein